LKETGIFYGSSSGRTESVARRIHQKLGEERAIVKDIADCVPGDLLSFRTIILGVPTWGVGEIQEDWSKFLPGLMNLDLNGRRVALFGLGNQESYPGTFADAMGEVYDTLQQTGCEFIGTWPAREYDFRGSAAIRDGMFIGLVIDEENQPELTDKRISDWLKEIL
jgi:flavodoxin I